MAPKQTPCLLPNETRWLNPSTGVGVQISLVLGYSPWVFPFQLPRSSGWAVSSLRPRLTGQRKGRTIVTSCRCLNANKNHIASHLKPRSANASEVRSDCSKCYVHSHNAASQWHQPDRHYHPKILNFTGWLLSPLNVRCLACTKSPRLIVKIVKANNLKCLCHYWRKKAETGPA